MDLPPPKTVRNPNKKIWLSSVTLNNYIIVVVVVVVYDEYMNVVVDGNRIDDECDNDVNGVKDYCDADGNAWNYVSMLCYAKHDGLFMYIKHLW